MRDKAQGMIGLAARAGRLVYGGDAGQIAVRRGKAYLVILACDAGERTKKLMQNKCSSFGVPIVEYETKETLGIILGKNIVSAVSVTDKNFADAILKKMS